MQKFSSQDRSLLIRLASSLPPRSPQRLAILAGLKAASGPPLITKGSHKWGADSIRQMLDGHGGISNTYKDADNLPKWLSLAGHKRILQTGPLGVVGWVQNTEAKKIPGAPWDINKPDHWQSVAEVLQDILDDGQPVNISSWFPAKTAY